MVLLFLGFGLLVLLPNLLGIGFGSKFGSKLLLALSGTSTLGSLSVLLLNLLGIRLGSKFSSELLTLSAPGSLLVLLSNSLGVGFGRAFRLESHLYHLRDKYCVRKQGIHSRRKVLFIA
ncbi:hypothetical protein SAMN05421790_10398 [Kroppenstedtia eburnea]|uniref:Uncharacterized protein n=1 Tax=Kroppenstedtia eburnea TaxID=714067 RepID=A0A1N7KIP3_9BACL|nr:hypothetical protein SAMN05421790_10398 [Kroppenstedtia eburnea]